jgi:hypothetical protein
MPTELILTKTAGGALAPANQQAVEYMAKLKTGATVTATVKRQRNPAFHRKMFALLNFAFDAWEPAAKEYKGQPVQKNFEQFRRDVTILAGYYETSYNLKGEVRLTPKSISFGSMDEDEFGQLYSAIINVILSRILTKYTRDDLDTVVENLLRFE